MFRWIRMDITVLKILILIEDDHQELLQQFEFKIESYGGFDDDNEDDNDDVIDWWFI